MAKLILASASPRRSALLDLIRLPYEVIPSNIQEKAYEWLEPGQQVVRRALDKIESLSDEYKGRIILGADTIVLFNNKVLGKPHNALEAISTLRLLSGKWHKVLTGLAIMNASTGMTWTDWRETRVCFRPLSEGEIVSYVDTKEPLDKAGAYGIQERGSVFIEKIEGCYYNVVGLPLASLYDGLNAMGISIWKNK